MKRHQKSYIKAIAILITLTCLFVCTAAFLISWAMFVELPVAGGHGWGWNTWRAIVLALILLGCACLCGAGAAGGIICLYKDMHPAEYLPALSLLPFVKPVVRRNPRRFISTRSLVVGDLIEVRSASEILGTLDETGCLEAMPFMPEMLQFCGKRFRVYKRADKTCDTITGTFHGRRMKNSVHLAELRCNGEHHGGCDATCLIYWKEKWLKRVSDETEVDRDACGAEVSYSPEQLSRLIEFSTVEPSDDTTTSRYRCQITELIRASSPLHWWDPRQYVRDVLSGNISLGAALIHSLIVIFNLFQKLHKGAVYPYFDPALMRRKKTPSARLNLLPGELIEVKSKEEILATLDDSGKNRGLYYDMHGEMDKYCGQRTTVLKKVRKIVDEKDGRLVTLPNDCVILNDFICTGEFSPNRCFCPRALYPFWREIWLKRVSDQVQS